MRQVAQQGLQVVPPLRELQQLLEQVAQLQEFQERLEKVLEGLQVLSQLITGGPHQWLEDSPPPSFQELVVYRLTLPCLVARLSPHLSAAQGLKDVIRLQLPFCQFLPQELSAIDAPTQLPVGEEDAI